MNDTKAGTMQRLDLKRATGLADRIWESEIVPALTDYIRIPNKSPHFDPDWQARGHMRAAADLIEAWCRARAGKAGRLPGLKIERVELPGRTPLLFMELAGKGDDTVLLYGHLDKQPEMTGWRAGFGPWTPVLEGDRLYGRGGADDGYAAFASLAALEILADQGARHARCVVLIEACEESGSYDLPAYIDHLAPRIGAPSLVVCLDSGCGDYERLWSTTSLRGNMTGNLIVEILTEGVHSGDASGIVPDSFRILRALLSRLEDEASGRIVLAGLDVEIPPGRIEESKRCAGVLGDRIRTRYPFVTGAAPAARDLFEHVLNRTWRPALTVTGADGLPKIGDAGNVLRPHTAVKLSLRLPPTLDGAAAAALLKDALLGDPPYGARVRLEDISAAGGWNAPALEPWLARAIEQASQAHFGKPAAAMGEGGSIPFMSMLGRKFPEAQFLITGVLGPEANAHGPNEFLHIPTGKRVTGCVASIIADHFMRRG